jgi:hypothetical protein
MDIDVFIQGNADFRVTTGKSRRSIQGASRARHARLAAAIYRLRSTGCQGVGARIEESGDITKFYANRYNGGQGLF